MSPAFHVPIILSVHITLGLTFSPATTPQPITM